MKKVFGAILVLGIFSGVAYAYGRSPERSACMKMGELCGESKGSLSDLDHCVDEVKKLRKVAGDEAVDKGMKCIDKSTSCPQAVGCIYGASMKGMSGFLKEFAKGMDQGLSE